jgi:hypothetical protein
MLAGILILSPVCGFRPSGQIPTLAGMVTLAPKDRDLPILKKANQDNLQIIDIRGGGDIPANAAEMGGIDKDRG